MADLFVWMCRQYPHGDDPNYDGAFFVGPRDNARSFRDNILTALKERGTLRAVAAIRHIQQELPELTWVKWVLLDAQERMRHHTWTPLLPAAILALADNRHSRLVQNGAQLLDVLIESLQRLEAKLRGETPAAIDLWNELDFGVYRPKDENRFSDYVKRHFDADLKARGVVVNREVEIRRGEGSFEGERTDIHVDAVLRGEHGESYDQITAIVEVKGCWHPQLRRAMETQLKNRYLRENQCQHGLYLVGWFNCNQWSNKDGRKRRAPKMSIEDARREFDAQAESLSDDRVLLKAFALNTSLPS